MIEEHAVPLGDGKFAVAIDRPSSVDELREVVKSRVAKGQAVYPQGGCTALDFGGIPTKVGVALFTDKLARVIDYPHEDMTITIEAGLTLSELARVLDQHNQRFCLESGSPNLATIGGVFATNWSGPRRYGLGRPRDQILGIAFVNGEGELVRGGGRVVKNVAGYDLPRLLTGSMGTVGVIAEVTLKVRPKPEQTEFVAVPVSRLNLAEALSVLNTSEARPIAIEVLSATAAFPLGTPLGEHWSLFVGIEGSVETVNWQREKILKELHPFMPADVSEMVFAGTDAQGVLDWLVSTVRVTDQLTIQANIQPSKVAAFVSEFELSKWSIQAHAGSGIVFGHLENGHGLEEITPEIERLRNLAETYHGNLTLPRCPTDWKSKLKVWGNPRPDWLIAQRLKSALDPKHLLNPGRSVGNI